MMASAFTASSPDTCSAASEPDGGGALGDAPGDPPEVHAARRASVHASTETRPASTPHREMDMTECPAAEAGMTTVPAVLGVPVSADLG